MPVKKRKFTMKVPCLIAVKDLYTQCSYPTRENAIAMSDCCRMPATTAVNTSGSDQPEGYWRCEAHKGLIKGNVKGYTVENVVRFYEEDLLPHTVIQVLSEAQASQ